MRKFGPFLLLFGFFCVAVAQADDGKDKKPTPKVAIGKDTTYVEGPLDRDGYIDYETALNKLLSRGVKPQSNANVLLVRAFGPVLERKERPADYYKWLGIEAPPERGDYFVGLFDYLRVRGKLEREEDLKLAIEQQSLASR